MDTPMTSWPCSASSAAATDESTPPDIATTMRIVLCPHHGSSRSHEEPEVPRRILVQRFFVSLRVLREDPWRLSAARDRLLPCQSSQFFHQPRQYLDDAVDFLFGRKHAETEAQRVLRPVG